MKRLLLKIGGGLLIVILVVLVLHIRAIGPGLQAYRAAMSGKRNLETALSAARDRHFSEALPAASAAAADFATANTQFAKARTYFWLSRLESVRRELANGERLLKTAEILSRSLEAGARIGVKAENLAPGHLNNLGEFSQAEKVGLLRLLYESGPELNGLKANLQLSIAELDAYEPGFLPLSGQISALKPRLQTIESWLEKLTVISELSPALSGYPQAADYLIMLQNPDELRPTGGFLGTYAWLRLKDGNIDRLQTADIYHLDMPASLVPAFKPEAPLPIKKYLGVDRLYLRDSNWSPDWPTSAQKIADLYRQEAALNSDKAKADNLVAVAGVTPRLITDLLYMVGPIKIGDKEYNSQNFTDLLQYEVEVGYKDKGVSQWDRKAVIGEILKELEARLFSLSSDRWPELLDTITKDITYKNLQVHFLDPRLENLSREFGWDGAVQDNNGDYLMIVDANLASFKSDRVMEKSAAYSVSEAEDGSLVASLRLSYSHQGGFDWKTTRYRSYTRVYVPLGSRLLKAEGWREGPETQEEHFGATAKTYFGGFLNVEPGQTGVMTLEYRLPDSVAAALKANRYELLVQKQAGREASEMRLDFNFKKAMASSPSGSKPASAGQALEIQGATSTDASYPFTF